MRGFFSQSPETKAYTLGPAIWQLASQMRQSNPLLQVAREHVAAMDNLLRAVVDWGTGRAAAFGRSAAGKSGTSQDSRDAWFVGYSGGLVTGVWVGNDDFKPMKRITGGGLPARLWRAFMVGALKS